MKKKGILNFEKNAADGWNVFLVRNSDKGKQAVKNFGNSASYIHLNGVEIEYLKFGKQLQLFEKGKNKPFYDSTKPATAKVISKSKVESRTVIKQPQPRAERNTDRYYPKQEKKFKGKNLFDSNSIKYSKLPNEVKNTVRANQIDNFNLLLNKAVHFLNTNGSKISLSESDSLESEPALFRTGLENSQNRREKYYFDISEYVTSLFEKDSYQILIRDCNDRQSSIANQKENFVKSTTFSPDWRLIIGLGGASVYETSITLHHIYGIPYIPASSIKGTVRSYIIREIFLPKYLDEYDAKKANEDAEKEAMKDDTFKLFFGNQDQKGKLTFYDAFPTSPPKIEVDIMNPHYDKYYQGKTPPVDTLSPTPIPFLTVAGCDFQFLIGSEKEECFSEKLGEVGAEKSITDWLKEALTNHGIGAKTAIGYGYMEETN